MTIPITAITKPAGKVTMDNHGKAAKEQFASFAAERPPSQKSCPPTAPIMNGPNATRGEMPSMIFPVLRCDTGVISWGEPPS